MKRAHGTYCSGILGLAVVFTCGFTFAPPPRPTVDYIVTAAPAYDALASLRGEERFSKGARLLIVHAGIAQPLVSGFAASADASVAFDAKTILFAGKKSAGDPWQIWEMRLDDRSVRAVTHSMADAIRPLCLPLGRFVYAQRTPRGFQLMSARVSNSAATEALDPQNFPEPFALTYAGSSAVPDDVLADGRILFESAFPLGSGTRAEMFLAYADGSGVESYRCDHGLPRWGGRQMTNGDVVFTHGTSLSRFTSASAHEEPIAAPRTEYAGGIAELEPGRWLVSARDSAKARYSLRILKQGTAALSAVLTRAGENLIDPVLIVPRARPLRHPSALHPWDYANLLALDARQSREGAMAASPVSVRVESRDAAGSVTALGTATVEPDGSFFVKVPGDRAIRIALLDARGAVLRRQKGWFWARAGEQRICVGCHTGPEHTAENRRPAVLERSTTPTDLTGNSVPQSTQKASH